MHQQPPKMPLCLATNASNAGQVASDSASTRYSLMAGTYRPTRTKHVPDPTEPTAAAGCRNPDTKTVQMKGFAQGTLRLPR